MLRDGRTLAPEQLRQPRFQVAEVPPNVRLVLNPAAVDLAIQTPPPAALPMTTALPAPRIEKPHVRLAEALRSYFAFIRTASGTIIQAYSVGVAPAPGAASNR